MGIAFLAGVASVGWIVGKWRLVYVRVVPPDRKTEYMAVYYAWIGLVGGVGPFAAGWAVDHFQGLKGGFGPFHLDAYSPLFLAGLLFLLGALGALRRLRE
jgi:MFS-type transporter involved in bile tolerance (Atg22 family)